MFLGERAVLEGKFQKLYEPLYKKRYEIVNEKGVPYFWATALKNDGVLAQKITKCDDGALRYLKDIMWTNINWHPGKSLTASLLKRPRKRSKNAEFMTKQRSFFNFFNTLEYPELPDDYTTYMHHDNFRKIKDQFELQKDLVYDVGKTIRDKIIPHAVSLFHWGNWLSLQAWLGSNDDDDEEKNEDEDDNKDDEDNEDKFEDEF
ncbi:hypothetical protein ACLB2K_059297 [Fragaria x ananassa]